MLLVWNSQKRGYLYSRELGYCNNKEELRPMDQYSIFLFVLLLATLGDLLIPIIIGLKYPGYDHFIDTISELGTRNSPVHKAQCWNLKHVGILFFYICHRTKLGI